MARRKLKKKTTLTKIDLDILKNTPYGVSQHGIGSGRRVTTTVNPVERPTANPLQPDISDIFDADPSNFSDGLDNDFSDEETSRGFYIARVSASSFSWARRDSFQCQDNPLLLWTTAERDTLLREFIRLEGRGVFTEGRCELCHQSGLYRCLDCTAVHFVCGDCMKQIHHFNFFHEIEVCLPSIT